MAAIASTSCAGIMRCGVATIRGIIGEGVAAALKIFPGAAEAFDKARRRFFKNMELAQGELGEIAARQSSELRLMVGISEMPDLWPFPGLFLDCRSVLGSLWEVSRGKFGVFLALQRRCRPGLRTHGRPS
jgi:hypothetical protein